MLHKCHILDTTLREGEQTPGVQFSLSDKCRIIDGLATIGVDEVELGIGSPLVTCLPDLLDHCRRNWPRLRTSIWSRCRGEDIEYTTALRPDVISLSIPVSDLHLHDRLGKSRAWALETMTSSIAQAKNHGLAVAVGFEDASRANPEFLLEMAINASAAGAFRLRLADTVGICSPGTIRSLLQPLLKALPSIQWGVHTHNDFGMATANAITAIDEGATWADTTILGLGERSGCAHLEEIVAYLHLQADHHHLAPQHLRSLAEFVASRLGIPIPEHLPILGRKIFTCETGLHLQGLHNNPATYEPYSPELVGATRHLHHGTKTGRRALAQFYTSLNMELDNEAILEQLHIRRTGSISSPQDISPSNQPL